MLTLNLSIGEMVVFQREWFDYIELLRIEMLEHLFIRWHSYW